MSEYTPIYTKPYPDGWKDLPTKETPVTAGIMDEYDGAIESIENYLAENPIESGGGGDTDLTDLVVKNSISMGRDPISGIGMQSMAIGDSAIASGTFSFAMGDHAEASGTYGAYSEGKYTLASSSYQHVQGKYNVEDTQFKYAHIVGGGSSDADRKNIHTLDWQGNAEYAGTVKSAGLKLTDTVTGQEYMLTVSDGSLEITAV